MKTLYIYGTVYNNKGTIEKTINSLYPLTKKFKLYFSIIDNFSSDGTYEWLISNSKNYENTIFQIKQVKCNRGKGRSIALNEILKIADTNDFTFYIDFDTIYLKRFLDYVVNFIKISKENRIGINHLSFVKYNYNVEWKNLNYCEDVERNAHFKSENYKLDISQEINNSLFFINQDRGNSLKEREIKYEVGLKYYIRIFSNMIDVERGEAFPSFKDFYNESEVKSKFRLLVFYFAYLIAKIKGIYSYSDKDNNQDFIKNKIYKT